MQLLRPGGRGLDCFKHRTDGDYRAHGPRKPRIALRGSHGEEETAAAESPHDTLARRESYPTSSCVTFASSVVADASYRAFRHGRASQSDRGDSFSRDGGEKDVRGYAQGRFDGGIQANRGFGRETNEHSRARGDNTACHERHTAIASINPETRRNSETQRDLEADGRGERNDIVGAERSTAEAAAVGSGATPAARWRDEASDISENRQQFRSRQSAEETFRDF
jgi:hypothetical protein